MITFPTFLFLAVLIFVSVSMWGHNLARQHTHVPEDIDRHLGMVSKFMLRELWYAKLVRYFFAKFEPYFLRMGEMAVRNFGRRGKFFRGPLKIIPLLLGWVVKQIFLSEVYTKEEVECLMENFARKYTFTIASQGICPCRKAVGKYSTVLPNATDFQILAHSRIYPKVEPDYREVPVGFVIRKIREFDRRGLVHMVFGICGIEGSEVVICNCSASVCFPLRAAIVGLFPVIPGYAFMTVDLARCDPDCPVQARCLKICPMRARQVGSEGRVFVNATRCIGCGVCRNVCPNEANIFAERGKKYHRVLPRSLLAPDAVVGEPVSKN